MTMTLADLDFLSSTTGEALLAQLAQEDLSPQNQLGLISQLRKHYSADQSRAALSMARLQKDAVAKFGDSASQMWFTDSALQQASDPLVRRYRSHLASDLSSVLDVGCGIGSDALSFADAGLTTMGIDIDPVRVAMAEHNARTLRLKNTSFAVMDARAGITADDYDLIFFDPARRDEQGKRIYDVERYIPPLSLVKEWKAPQIMVKLSPGVDRAQLEPYGGEQIMISSQGQLKECLLVLGEKSKSPRAVLLTQDQALEWQRPFGMQEPHVEIAEPQGWLCEPDPALLRAGLVADVAAHFEGRMLDETIAYFTTTQPVTSPWIDTWEIMDWMPFHLKKLRAYLRQKDIGPLIVKKRGSPIDPDTLIRQLKLRGSQPCVLILTRYRGAPIVIMCQ